ncbi:MAG: nucleotidyl transferase AbiEii/AbiGii toxin family protein [Oligoflexia bacterium]|nr:nucleotidyl transferase AbiEii/AbiGii toxin family protein [Oligoflexia bacterium]
MKQNQFYPQVELMLKCIPIIDKERVFALKGGTAINLFVRDMPRLSVDIDLTYVPIENREMSLQKMNEALERISAEIEKRVPGSKVRKTKHGHQIIKLVVATTKTSIKIEPNAVIRGLTGASKSMDLVKTAEDLFEMSVSISVVPMADLYGGKICAALDRQHPRDLFDIKILLENEGLTDKIRKGFLVYLASHDRPMHEVIAPTKKNIKDIFDKEFKDMTEIPTTLDDLYQVRNALIKQIHKDMTADEKEFLISLKSAEPNWGLLGIKGVEKLPAIQWKLQNIKKMAVAKRNEQLTKLKKALEI